MYRGGDWDSGGSCNGETEPVLSGAILNNYPLKMKIVEEVVKEMKVPVRLLNVTRLTNFRKDGHPSVYGKKVVAGQKVSTRRQDCSHWCLPGVPDAWNELIYATLVFQKIGSKTKIQWLLFPFIFYFYYYIARKAYCNLLYTSQKVSKESCITFLYNILIFFYFFQIIFWLRICYAWLARYFLKNYWAFKKNYFDNNSIAILISEKKNYYKLLNGSTICRIKMILSMMRD